MPSDTTIREIWIRSICPSIHLSKLASIIEKARPEARGEGMLPDGDPCLKERFFVHQTKKGHAMDKGRSCGHCGSCGGVGFFSSKQLPGLRQARES